MKPCRLICLLCLWPLLLTAQKTTPVPKASPPVSQTAAKSRIVLTGTVADSLSGEGLAGALVSVVAPGDTVRCLSGKEGKFSCTVVSREKYTFIVSFLGYAEKNFRNISRNRAFSESVSISARLDFLKRCYFNANYNGRFYSVINGPGHDITSHILNAALGCRLFKNGKGDACIAAYDILNRGNSEVNKVLRDYSSYTWSNRFGRYFSFNLGYRFNVTRKGKLPDYDFE